MKPDFMVRTARIIAEVRNRTCIDDDVEVIKELLQDELKEYYDALHDEGSEEGYDAGYYAGSEAGYDAGYSDGHSEGYDNGYTDGKSSLAGTLIVRTMRDTH